MSFVIFLSILSSSFSLFHLVSLLLSSFLSSLIKLLPSVPFPLILSFLVELYPHVPCPLWSPLSNTVLFCPILSHAALSLPVLFCPLLYFCTTRLTLSCPLSVPSAVWGEPDFVHVWSVWLGVLLCWTVPLPSGCQHLWWSHHHYQLHHLRLAERLLPDLPECPGQC